MELVTRLQILDKAVYISHSIIGIKKILKKSIKLKNEIDKCESNIFPGGL